MTLRGLDDWIDRCECGSAVCYGACRAADEPEYDPDVEAKAHPEDYGE